MKKETLLKILFFVVPWCIAAAFTGAASAFLNLGKTTVSLILYGIGGFFVAFPILVIIVMLGSTPDD